MGSSVSQVFQSGSALLANAHGHRVSDPTRQKVQTVFDALRANAKIGVQRLEGLLQQIPKNENILMIHDESGYNLLQRCVGANNVELVRWLLARHSSADISRCPCSLPLHIACLKGYSECVELLLKHGAKIDVEARMCWPGPHSHNCEHRGKYSNINADDNCIDRDRDRPPKLQSAIYYALDGDQVDILEMLSPRSGDPWNGLFRNRKPLLHAACERGAWRCTQFLVTLRADEIHILKDEYYPIHYAVLHDSRFLELLINSGADTAVRTCTQQMTLLHVVFLVAHKSAEETISTIRLLLDHGCKQLINTPDSLGNTPLHALIVRYALEEARYGYDKWNKWDILHLVRYMIQAGARQSINQTGNSALACVLRHVRDWDICYELLNMLLAEGGEPNMVGRDGSVPIMVCLVPLINKDPLHHFTHSMKIPPPEYILSMAYNCSSDPPYKNVSRLDMYVKQNNLTYPINIGRNVARATSETHFIIVSDIELYPSPNIIPNFLKLIAGCEYKILPYEPAVFVLHIFEIEKNTQMPTNKTGLVKLLNKGVVIPFHRNICSVCHKIPLFEEWKNSDQSEELKIFNIGRRTGAYYHWEPIYIGTNAEPKYDERLNWEGMKDKVVQGYELCLMNYTFMVLDNAFLIHKPGIKVSDSKKNKWRKPYVDFNDKLIDKIIVPELKKKHKNKSECQL